MLDRHIALMDERIAELQRLRAALRSVATVTVEPGAPAAFCALIEGWTGSGMTTDKEVRMANGKRRVEVFTAGCPLCEPVVELVRRIACPSCDVEVYNLKDDPKAALRAWEAGVHRVPMVLVDGRPAECCQFGPVTEAGLRAGGVGVR